MSADIRCVCGAWWRIENDAAAARRVCPDCGRDLPLRGAAADVPLVKLAPLPAREPMETVHIAPYYEPDAPPRAQLLGHDACNPVRFDAEPPQVLPVHDPRRRRAIQEPYEPYYAHADFEEQELRRLVAIARREGRRYGRPRTRQFDKNGWDCFLFAGRAWWIILSFSFGWLILTPIMMLAMPTPRGLGPEMWLPRVFGGVVLVAGLAATWGFLRDVHRTGAEGGLDLKFHVLLDWRALLHSALMAMGALLAGPVVLLVAAIWFWIEAGALDWLDRLVIGQLAICAGVAWVYLLLAADARARLRELHAAVVVRLARSQGWAGWVFPLAGGVSVTGFCFLLVQLLALMLEEPIAAVTLQFLLWVAALYFWTGLMRWYGMTCYWRRAHRAAAA